VIDARCAYGQIEALCVFESLSSLVFVPYFPLRADGGEAAAQIAKRHGSTGAQIALAWLRRSPTTLPIPGTLSPEHLSENLDAAEIELTDEEF
jgi:pyridoxine 4-dehydrogenase